MAAQGSTPDAKQFTDHYVQANGLRFHYLDWGSLEKPPLVLLHGVGQTCHTWDLFAVAMSNHFHVMAFDQRGHGDRTGLPIRIIHAPPWSRTPMPSPMHSVWIVSF